MGEGNGGSGLGGVDGGVDGASLDPNGVDIGSDEGLELRLAGGTIKERIYQGT